MCCVIIVNVANEMLMNKFISPVLYQYRMQRFCLYYHIKLYCTSPKFAVKSNVTNYITLERWIVSVNVMDVQYKSKESRQYYVNAVLNDFRVHSPLLAA